MNRCLKDEMWSNKREGLDKTIPGVGQVQNHHRGAISTRSEDRDYVGRAIA